MNLIDAQTFNPEILYVFDPWNDENYSSQMHHHDFLELTLVLEGGVRYQFNEREGLDLTSGSILLFNPGYQHREEQTAGTCSHELHIGIRNISLTGLARNFFPNEDPLLHLGKYHHDVVQKAWELIEESNSDKAETKLMQKALVIEILVLILRGLDRDTNIFRASLTKSQKHQQQIVNYTIYYLENHHAEEITLEKLAQDQFISPTYLSKIFKEATGMSPINYLIEIRLKRAKELLKNQKHSVKEIATIVGYQDAFHFSKSFKKQFGVSPSTFLTTKK